MKIKNKPNELSIKSLKQVLKKTAVAVREANLGRGIPMTVIKNDQMVEIQPDGSRRVLKQHVAPLVRVKQMRFTLD